MRKIAWLAMAATLLLPGFFPGAASAQEKWSLEGGGEITSLSVGPEGSRLAVGSRAAKAIVYDLSGDAIFEAAANNVVNAVDLLADGHLVGRIGRSEAVCVRRRRTSAVDDGP